MIETKDYRKEIRLLDKWLIDFLNNLEPEDWNKKTVAGQWTVKDVAAHLLDGNLRILSALRDRYAGEKVSINDYNDLVNYLNRLNADWVQAMKRISPLVLTELLLISGKEYCDYYDSLNLKDYATFSVAWAGEEKSYNSFHIAREFTEKFHHQQQIREALHDATLLQHSLLRDFMDILMLAMPHTLREIKVSERAGLSLSISGYQTFSYSFQFVNGKWNEIKTSDFEILASANIPDTIAWKLFTKSVRPETVKKNIELTGNKELATNLLNLIAVMA